MPGKNVLALGEDKMTNPNTVRFNATVIVYLYTHGTFSRCSHLLFPSPYQCPQIFPNCLTKGLYLCCV